MRVPSDEEDERFKERVREEFGIPGDTENHWEPIDIGSYVITPWRDREENDEKLRKLVSLLKKNERRFIVAFSGGQYVPKFQKKFEEKYNAKTTEIEPEEIPEVREDLINFYVFPEDLSWVFLGDHEGSLVFSGDIIEDVKEIIDEEKLEEREY